MRVLLLSAWFPDPPSNGSRLRVSHLLRALAPVHDVSLLSFADQPDVDPAAPALRALCREVQVVPAVRFDPRAWRARVAFVGPQPRSLAATFSPVMAAAIHRSLGERAYDVIVASELACAAYGPGFDGIPAVFEDVELGALSDQRTAGPRGWRRAVMWAKYARYLRGLRRYYRAFTVVSEPERQLLADVLGDDRAIHLVPNGVAVAEYGSAGAAVQADTLVFTGSLRYRPNYDAMCWFVGMVWPRIQQVRPAARLLITGAHDDLPLPPATNVVRTGCVDDVRPLLAAASLSIAPIFAGGGTRLKILEAMATGTPVVATAKGVEGIDAVGGQHLLIADDPATFAEHVLSLLADSALRERLSQAGRALVEERYDWRTLGPRFEALVRAVAS